MTSDASLYPNWLDLPEVLLVSVLCRIVSIPDVFAFRAVCTTWRSVAKSYGVNTTNLAPLLLDVEENPRIFRLRDNLRSYRTGLTPDILSKACIGYSFGNLIIALSETKILLADIFTGHEISPPDIPNSRREQITYAILTAPISSPLCTLLLTTSSNESIICWHRERDEWFVFNLDLKLRSRSLVVCGKRVLCTDRDNRLVKLELFPSFRCEKLESSLPRCVVPCFHNFDDYHLVDCDGVVLLVVFVSAESGWMNYSLKIRLEVYKMVGLEWVMVEDIGDWCVFVDTVGRGVVSCRSPTRWGGKRNCVYVAGPGSEGWSVFLVGGGAVDAGRVVSRQCPLAAANWTLPRWPSPVCLYPSILY